MLQSAASGFLRFCEGVNAPTSEVDASDPWPAEAVVIHDLEWQFLEVDRATCEWLGYSREALLGKTMLDVHVPADQARVSQCIKELQQNGRAVFKSALVRRDGAIIPMETSSRLIEYAGARAVLSILRDMGKRNQVEPQRAKLKKRLWQVQKVETLGQLAGCLAHGLNNLLFIISVRTELMLGRLGPDDPLRKELELVHKSGERASSLVRQFLAFSRRRAVEPITLDLNAIIAEMGDMLPRVAGQSTSLTTVLDPALKPVLADPGQIEQILMNLVLNARDAMPTGGRLTIETANAELDETYGASQARSGRSPYVMLAVSDTGCGMDEQVKAHLFEPFFTTKQSGKGSGLGLATVYEIVKKSRGHIAVYSEPGLGTTLKIYLPPAT